jgi:hypothetical protein
MLLSLLHRKQISHWLPTKPLVPSLPKSNHKRLA